MTAGPQAGGISESLSLELVRIGAVVFSSDKPFTWASGITAPVYCDNRLTMSHPPVRRMITRGFQEALLAAGVHPDIIVGTATAGIPHAAWLADRLELPMAYVRSSRKGHGRENLIEGEIREGANAVVVEDLVSTGGSCLGAVSAVREAGASVDIVLAVFSYGLPGVESAFKENRVRLLPLTTFSDLVLAADARGMLDHRLVEHLNTWHERLGREMAQRQSEVG